MKAMAKGLASVWLFFILGIFGADWYWWLGVSVFMMAIP
jgi:hypothetical protein